MNLPLTQCLFMPDQSVSLALRVRIKCLESRQSTSGLLTLESLCH